MVFALQHDRLDRLRRQRIAFGTIGASRLEQQELCAVTDRGRRGRRREGSSDRSATSRHHRPKRLCLKFRLRLGLLDYLSIVGVLATFLRRDANHGLVDATLGSRLLQLVA